MIYSIPSMKRSPVIPVLLLAVMLSITAFADNTATNPVPRDPKWVQRHEGFVEQAKQGGVELLFLGDSITDFWRNKGSNVWNQFYASRHAANFGISGDRTQHVLWRLEKAPLGNMKPKAAVVMIGTNNSNGEDNTPGQIADGVAAIVQTLRHRLPETKILLLGIFPRGENFNPQRGKLAQVNQVLQKLDDGKSVFYLDIGHRFLTSDGILPAEIMPDYLHLSKQGYERWAEAIEPKLAELLGEKR